MLTKTNWKQSRTRLANIKSVSAQKLYTWIYLRSGVKYGLMCILVTNEAIIFAFLFDYLLKTIIFL